MTRRLLFLLALGAATALAQSVDALALLRQGLGGESALTVRTFAYRLTVTDGADGRVLRDAHYRLDAATGVIAVQDRLSGERSWWDGKAGWRVRAGQLQALSGAEAAALRDAGAYNFVRLFRADGTRAEWVRANRVRVTLETGDQFEMELEPDGSGRVRENHFPGGRVGREFDHQVIGGLVWPMQFEIVADGVVLRRGRFSEISLEETPALAPGEVLPAARRELPTPLQSGAADLVGRGWISTVQNDYNLNFTADGARLVFARSEAHFVRGRVMLAERTADGWSEPREAPFTHEGWSDSDPWLTPDGRWLYFISNRPREGRGEAKKDFDLWRVAILGGEFGAPEPLDAANSPAQELGPEVHDGWLYFNSSRPGGPAKMSVYRARLGPDSGVGAPEPLPAPFNTGIAQGDFTLSPDGQVAVFWSMRAEHPKEGHLYAARRIAEGWSAAVRLPAPFASDAFDFTPEFSPDGRTLFFSSQRASAGDVVLNGQANVYALPADELRRALDGAR